MPNLLAHKKWISLFFVVLLIVVALGTTTPALAHWLGVPHRTKTVTVTVCKIVLQSCMYIESKGEYRYHTTEDWSCSNESKPWQKYPSNGGACPPGQDHWERDESEQTTVINLDPATIEGTLQNCTSYNGWCGVTAPALELNAFEPLSGYNITRIEWTRNGTEFACENGTTSCSIPLLEGDNNFTYWAHSSWGDTSDMGSISARVDTIPPVVTLSVTGTSGWNGWYKSPIQVTADVSDTTSGVATFEVAVDGGGYQPYTKLTPIPLSNDGVHALQFRASDNAGNVFESPVQNFYVDTIPPTVNLRGSWQLGKNVPYDAIDEGSGLAVLRVVIEDEDEKYGKVTWDESVSGTMYSQDIDWNGKFKDGTVAPPGTYLVWIKVSDVAGNEHFELAKIIVPEPNYVGPVVLPTEEPAITVAPPAELSQSLDITSLATPPPGGSGGTGTTTYSLTSTSGTAGGSAGTSHLGVGGGTASTSQTSLPWLPIAAAAVLGTSAVVAASTLKRTDPQDEQKQNTFPKNPIPASLFPGPAGGVKSIPSSQSGGGSTGGRENPRGGGTVGGAEHPRGGAVGGGERPKGGTVGDGDGGSGTPSWVDEVKEDASVGVNIAKSYINLDGLKDPETVKIIKNSGLETNAALKAGAKYDASNRLNAAVNTETVANAVNARVQADLETAAQNREVAIRSVNDAQSEVDRARKALDDLDTSADSLQRSRATQALDEAESRLYTTQVELDAQVKNLETIRTQAVAAADDLEIAQSQRAVARIDFDEAAKNFDIAQKAAANLPETSKGINAALDIADDALNLGGATFGGVSIVGAAMEGLGVEGGKTVSDVGTVGGALFDAGSLINTALRLTQGAKALPVPAVTGLAKAGAILAIPMGFLTGVTEGYTAYQDWQDGQLSRDGQAALVNSIGGWLTMAGGIAMLVPGGQLLGGVLLAVGGVASGVAWYIENKEKVDAAIKNAAQAVATAASNAWNAAAQTTSNVANVIKNTVSKAVNTAKDTVKKAADTVKNTVNKAVDTVKNTVSNAVNTVKNTVSNAVNTVKNTVSNAVNTVKNTVNNVVNTVKNTVSNAVNTVKNTVSNAVNTVKNTISNAVNTVKNTVNNAVNTVKTASQTVSKAVNTVTQSATNTVKSIGNTISNWFKKH